MARDIAEGVETCRATCPYFSICGGGVPVNKLTENGGFASARTRFCELTQMASIDLILDALERIDPAAPKQSDCSTDAPCRTQCLGTAA